MNVSSVIDSVDTLAIAFPGGVEILLIAGVALLLFGKRLPGAAKSLGMSFSAFKKGIKEGEDDLEQLTTTPSVETSSPEVKDESVS